MKIQVVILTLFLGACSALESKQERSNVYDLIKSHEIRQVATVDLTLKTMPIGDKIASQCNAIINSENWNCDVSKDSSWAEVEKQWQSDITLYTSASQIRDSVSRQVFEAYEYSLQSNYPLQPFVDEWNDNQMVYMQPFKLDVSNKKCEDRKLAIWHIVIAKKMVIDQLE